MHTAVTATRTLQPLPGRFIAFDGPDGAGKTTQAARLVDWLQGQGFGVVACRDPGGTPLGNRLRSLLLDHAEAHVPISMRAEMLMYMASRAQLVDEVITPALAAGKIVVSDRYLLANLVYQGFAGGLPAQEIWNVGMVATGGLLPHLTLVLDVSPEVAAQRVTAPRDRMEARPDDFHARVRAGFLLALETYPAPFALIDGAQDSQTIAAQIQSEVARALGLGART